METNKEIQSRREFFKKTAKAALPILGMIILTQVPSASVLAATNCDTCSGSCLTSCEGTCAGSCKGDCDSSCKDSCEGSCKGSCGDKCQF